MKIDNRIWIALTVLVCGALLAGAWFLGASPFLTAAATSAASTVEVAGTNAQTQAEIVKLTAQQSKLPELKERLAALRTAVPSAVQGTAFITEVNDISARTGVSVTAITIGAPTPYASPVAPAEAAPAANGAASSPSPSATPSAPAAPVATGPASPAVVTDNSITASNFIVVPITVAVKGTVDQSAAFLRGLQTGERLVLVTGVQRSTESDGNELTVTGSMYVVRPAESAKASTNG